MSSGNGPVQIGAVVVVSGPVLREISAFLKRGSHYFEKASGYRESSAMTEFRADVDRAIAAAGTCDARDDILGPDSFPSDKLSVSEVADMLNRSQRQVRKTAAAIGGEKHSGVWIFDRAAVLAEISRRDVA